MSARLSANAEAPVAPPPPQRRRTAQEGRERLHTFSTSHTLNRNLPSEVCNLRQPLRDGHDHDEPMRVVLLYGEPTPRHYAGQPDLNRTEAAAQMIATEKPYVRQLQL